MTVRVVVAEDHFLMREGILTALDVMPDVAVVATCATYDELLSAIAAAEHDMVLTAIRMPPTGAAL